MSQLFCLSVFTAQRLPEIRRQKGFFGRKTTGPPGAPSRPSPPGESGESGAGGETLNPPASLRRREESWVPGGARRTARSEAAAPRFRLRFRVAGRARCTGRGGDVHPRPPARAPLRRAPPLRQPSELSGTRDAGLRRPRGGRGGPSGSGHGPDQWGGCAGRPAARRSRRRRPALTGRRRREGSGGRTGTAARLGRGVRETRTPRPRPMPGGNCRARDPARGRGRTGNDPSAGSPTETLLRLLLPLDSQV